MTNEDFEDILPQGIVLGDRVNGGDPRCFTFMAEDRRLSTAEHLDISSDQDSSEHHSLSRFVRVVDLAALGMSREATLDFVAHLRYVVSHPLRGVWPVLEAGYDDERNVVWLVSPKAGGGSLTDHLRGQGLAAKDAWPLFRQIAEALAELHTQETPHGDVRTENVFLDSNDLSRATAKLGDWSIARLSSLSRGDFTHRRAAWFSDPDWNGRLEQRSMKADVYALGELGCELFCGCRDPRQEGNGKGWDYWRSRLEEVSIPKDQRAILQRLLDSRPDQRLGNANDVRELLNKTPNWPQWLWRGAAVVLFLLTIVGWWLAASLRSEVSRIETERDKITKERDEITKELEIVRKQILDIGTQIVRQSQELENLRGQHTEAGAILRQPRTDERWKKLRETLGVEDPTGSESAEDIWRQFPKTWKSSDLPELVKQHEKKPEHKLLSDWMNLVRHAWEANSYWLPYEKSANSATRQLAYESLHTTPWDSATKDRFRNAWWLDHIQVTGEDGKKRRPSASELPLRVEFVVDKLLKLSAENWVRKELLPLAKILRSDPAPGQKSDLATWEPWIPSVDETATNFLVDQALEPWNRDKVEQANIELKALNEARKIWKQLADIDELSWSDFKSATETAAGGIPDKPLREEVVRILSVWMTALETRSQWTVALGQAEMESGYGTWRLLTIYIPDRSNKDDWREWKSETAHDYFGEGPTITWRLGESIRLLLEGEKNYLGYRPDLIYAPQFTQFKGPVALWRMHNAGEISQKGTAGTTRFLKCSVKGWPGPPADRDLNPMIRELQSTVEEVLSTGK